MSYTLAFTGTSLKENLKTLERIEGILSVRNRKNNSSKKTDKLQQKIGRPQSKSTIPIEGQNTPIKVSRKELPNVAIQQTEQTYSEVNRKIKLQL